MLILSDEVGVIEGTCPEWQRVSDGHDGSEMVLPIGDLWNRAGTRTNDAVR
jgi:hypothetical protein